MQASRIEALVRDAYAAYPAHDRQVLEDLLADDFRFSSPDDPDLDRAGYFERCWPNNEHSKAIEIEKLFVRGEEAFVRYVGERTSGGRFRNAEFLRFEGDKLVEVQVYYGIDL